MLDAFGFRARILPIARDDNGFLIAGRRASGERKSKNCSQ